MLRRESKGPSRGKYKQEIKLCNSCWIENWNLSIAKYHHCYHKYCIIDVIVANFTAEFETAIQDFLQCLEIQTQYLEPESRLIAETHYQIGIAYNCAQKYDEAVQDLRKAMAVINAKISEYQVL